MTTRKVTAIEDQVLTAARVSADAYAEYKAAVERAAKEFGRVGCALRPEPSRLWEPVRAADLELVKTARLLKQRRPKVKK
jgi:hypothetical protein